jgi:hypothetical protein
MCKDNTVSAGSSQLAEYIYTSPGCLVVHRISERGQALEALGVLIICPGLSRGTVVTPGKRLGCACEYENVDYCTSLDR